MPLYTGEALTAEEMAKFAEITRAAYDEKDALAAEGHTCVVMMESIPTDVVWCHQKECTGQARH